MKKSLMAFTLVTLMATFCPTAKTVPDNPVNTSFDLLTYEESPVFWKSDANVGTGYLQYDYEWQLTHELSPPWPARQIQIAEPSWMLVDIWNDILDDGKNGSGSIGPPVVLPIVDELILHIDYPEITADFLFSVNESGYGTIFINNIPFGSAQGYEVTGARLRGNITVEGVPELIIFPVSLGQFSIDEKTHKPRRTNSKNK